ncbi:MAG: hypothetical protein Q8M03_09075 [Legionella sp.]|nr:hypothetical protein [Legionella sp.]
MSLNWKEIAENLKKAELQESVFQDLKAQYGSDASQILGQLINEFHLIYEQKRFREMTDEQKKAFDFIGYFLCLKGAKLNNSLPNFSLLREINAIMRNGISYKEQSRADDIRCDSESSGAINYYMEHLLNSREASGWRADKKPYYIFAMKKQHEIESEYLIGCLGVLLMSIVAPSLIWLMPVAILFITGAATLPLSLILALPVAIAALSLVGIVGYTTYSVVSYANASYDIKQTKNEYHTFFSRNEPVENQDAVPTDDSSEEPYIQEVDMNALI